MQRRTLLESSDPWLTVWRWIAGPLLAILVLASCAQSAELRGRLEPESVVTIGFDDFSSTSVGSTGHSVCATGPGVFLESVDALKIDGAAELIGAVEISGVVQRDGFIGAVYGFPPEGWASDALGTYAVPECDPTSPDSVTQVVLGVRRTEPTGGAIRGVSITYRSGGRTGTLEIPNFHITLCGDDGRYCEDELSS
ncbi:MAG: hypothetical protein GXP34_00300 [Actinobacteria bacterium]|nr:hypothetical protein [Actinomycetota bacterium]